MAIEITNSKESLEMPSFADQFNKITNRYNMIKKWNIVGTVCMPCYQPIHGL